MIMGGTLIMLLWKKKRKKNYKMDKNIEIKYREGRQS